jgi:COP9 signalosome complex subunit 4
VPLRLQDATGLVVSRQLLLDVAQALGVRVPAEDARPLLVAVLDRVQPRLVIYEEQVSVLRETLATLYERTEEWTEAAKVLIGIPLDSSNRCAAPYPRVDVWGSALTMQRNRAVVPAYKLGIYIRIAQLYLEDDDAVAAEAYINRASLLVPDCQDPAMIIKHKVPAAARSWDVEHMRVAETSLGATHAGVSGPGARLQAPLPRGVAKVSGALVSGRR